MEYKYCTKCNIRKPISEFYIIHKGKHCMSECKTCYIDRTKQHKKTHKQQYTLMRQRWRSNNRLADNLTHLQYAHAHIEMRRLRSNISTYKKMLKLKNTEVIFEKLPYGKLTTKILQQRLETLKAMNRKQ